ncbi:MAG: integrase family protein [Rhodobacteraceae bacterium]|nr:integrase family protein [Paracoccaceae bacterium]
MALTTDVAIKKWKPEKDGEAQSTGARSGLYVRGWTTGAKVFYFRTGGTWLRVGDYPALSLSAARDIAASARRLVADGHGPKALQRALAVAASARDLESAIPEVTAPALDGPRLPTYSEVFGEWWSAKESKLQDGPSRRRPKSLHDRLIAPTIGNRPILQIRRREIFDMLAPAFAETPVSAGYALGYLRAVFDFAAVKEYVDANPVPPRSAFDMPRRAPRHHGTIEHAKLPDLWAAVSATDANPSAKLAILTAMCTAHRMGVICNARFADLDPAAGTWTIPARTDKATVGRMKSGREYTLRLPPALLRQLLALRKKPAQVYVFESPSTTGPISGTALVKTLKRFDPKMTGHGFRNAVKVFCRENGIPDHVADAFCDHAPRGLDAAYRRQDTSRERADLAAMLYRHVTGKDPAE